jgi:polyhydroxyalkanoate synthesis regulator phasin
MSNLFEKSINLGLGLLVHSREKVEELVEELVSKGEVAHKDARQFAAELVQKVEEQKQELKKLIQAEVAKTLDHANVAKKDELVTKDEIREMIREEIRKALAEYESSKNAAEK